MLKSILHAYLKSQMDCMLDQKLKSRCLESKVKSWSQTGKARGNVNWVATIFKTKYCSHMGCNEHCSDDWWKYIFFNFQTWWCLPRSSLEGSYFGNTVIDVFDRYDDISIKAVERLQEQQQVGMNVKNEIR